MFSGESGQNRMRGIRRYAVAVSAFLAILLNVVFVLYAPSVIYWGGFSPDSREKDEIILQPKEKTDKKKEKVLAVPKPKPAPKQRSFVLLPQPKDKVVKRPKDARVESMFDSIARQPVPDSKLRPGDFTLDGKARHVSDMLLPGRRVSQGGRPSKKSDQQPQRVLPQRKAQPKLIPLKGDRQAKTKPSPFGKLPPLQQLASKERLGNAKRDRKPVFRDLREQQSNSQRNGQKEKPGNNGIQNPQKWKSKSSAIQVGKLTMAAIKAKYPEWFVKAKANWMRSIVSLRGTSLDSYSSCDVYCRVALKDDAKIDRMAILAPGEGSLAEKKFAVDSITGMIFPELTDEMKKDPLFKQLMFVLSF